MDKPLRQYVELMRPIKIGEPAYVTVKLAPRAYGIFTTSIVKDYIDIIGDNRPVFETENTIYVPTKRVEYVTAH